MRCPARKIRGFLLSPLRCSHSGHQSHHILSCEICCIFPCELSSFRRGAEYLGELLWQSYVKPKLRPKPVPHTGQKNPQNMMPSPREVLSIGVNKCNCTSHLVLHSSTALPEPEAAQPRCHIARQKRTVCPAGATRTQQCQPTHVHPTSYFLNPFTQVCGWLQALQFQLRGLSGSPQANTRVPTVKASVAPNGGTGPGL